MKGTKRFIRWRVILANAVENLYATYHYSDRAGSIVFIGEELDVFISTEMYRYLVKTIDRLAKFRQSYNSRTKQKANFPATKKLGYNCKKKSGTIFV